MFENSRRGRQARNFTTNVPKILDLKSSSEQIFFRKLSLGAPVKCKWEISLCCRYIRAGLCQQIKGTVTKSLRYQFIAPVHTNPHMSWKILIIVDNVYKGFSFIDYLTIVTLILITTFRPHTAGLHQAIVSIYWVGLFVPPWWLDC